MNPGTSVFVFSLAPSSCWPAAHYIASQGIQKSILRFSSQKLVPGHHVPAGSVSTVDFLVLYSSDLFDAPALRNKYFFQFLLHRVLASHLIWYPTEFLSHPPGFPLEQQKQFVLPHSLFLKGSAMASFLIALPALVLTVRWMPLAPSNILQASFNLAVRSQGLGSTIKGAEIWPLLALCQVSFIFSFSSLREASCHFLALCIGLPPSSSSLPARSHFSTTSLTTWCLVVAGQPDLLSFIP